MHLAVFVASDAAVMAAGDADPEFRRRFEFPDDFTPSLAHSEQVIGRWHAERVAGTRFSFAVRSTATSELLGGCELRPRGPGSANVSYWTYPPHRHQGVATRALRLACEVAFTEFRFHTLEVLIDADNVASCRVACASGFEESGRRDGRLLFVRRARDRRKQ